MKEHMLKMSSSVPTCIASAEIFSKNVQFRPNLQSQCRNVFQNGKPRTGCVQLVLKQLPKMSSSGPTCKASAEMFSRLDAVNLIWTCQTPWLQIYNISKDKLHERSWTGAQL